MNFTRYREQRLVEVLLKQTRAQTRPSRDARQDSHRAITLYAAHKGSRIIDGTFLDAPLMPAILMAEHVQAINSDSGF